LTLRKLLEVTISVNVISLAKVSKKTENAQEKSKNAK